MARYAFGPLRGEEISWWPTESLVLSQPKAVAEELVDTWITSWSRPGDIILDPFCQSARVVTRAAEQDRSVIAIHFDPLADLRTRLALKPPPIHLLDALLTRLADTPKLNTTLRDHLQSLYLTPCSTCGSMISADYFLWDREGDIILRKGYRCPRCRAAYAESASPSDTQQAKLTKAEGLHYWYLYDRLSPKSDAERALTKRLLELYTPRNLYVIAQLLLKSESLFSDSELLDAWRWVSLNCLDISSKLHAFPQAGTSYRLRQLRPPRQFLEVNVWLALEQAIEALKAGTSDTLVELVEEPAELLASHQQDRGRAYVDWRSVRSLAQALPAHSVALIVAQPPQFDPVYWPLAYLWSGWIYGERATASLYSLAKRRANSWLWYLKAVEIAFKTFNRLLQPQGYMALAFKTSQFAYQDILMLAAASTGFRLAAGSFIPDDVSAITRPFRGQNGEYCLILAADRQGIAQPSLPKVIAREHLAARIREEAHAVAVEALRQRGEPLNSAALHMLIWQRLETGLVLQQVMVLEEEETMPWDLVNSQIKLGLTEALSQDLHWLSEDGEPQRGTWWLKSPPPGVQALDDRIERAIRELLPSQPVWAAKALYSKMEELFPPPLTPEPQLVKMCLASYAHQLDTATWQSLGEETLLQRQRERGNLARALLELGQRLGCLVWPSPCQQERLIEIPEIDASLDILETTKRIADVIWRKPDGTRYIFVLRDTAEIDDVLGKLPGPAEGQARYLVISARRWALLRYKIWRSLWRRKTLRTKQWHLIKDVDVQQLAEAAEVDWHEWAKIAPLQPSVEQADAQLSLFQAGYSSPI